MVIVFDLDHTLYDEYNFVKGGMSVVADFLCPILEVRANEILDALLQELKVKREGVFNRLLEKYGKKNQKLIRKCLSIYRLHDPQISLLPEAQRCLKRFKSYPLYVVTDGNKVVQKRKFLALDLAPLIKHCFCTYAYGKKHSKPSTYCFEKICMREKVRPNEIVYIGDDPSKDFVGLKSKGFHTIRLLRGPHANKKVSSSYEADTIISSLDELDENLLDQVFNSKRRTFLSE